LRRNNGTSDEEEEGAPQGDLREEKVVLKGKRKT